MVEKEYSEQIRVNPAQNKMTFKEHVSDLTAEFDQALLKQHLPVTSGVQQGDKTLVKALGAVIPETTREALNETEFVGVYGRVVHSKTYPHLMCLQYLYVWDYQAVPTHEGDYEPVFVFLDKNRKYAIYDLVHYCSRRIDFDLPVEGTLGLRMIPGWHSFLPSLISKDSCDKNLELKPLSDQHLHSWWSIPDESARLKIVNRFKDPFLLEAPGHFMDSPDEHSITMCCTFLEIEKALVEFEDPKVAIVEGIKRAFSKCVGLFALYRLNAFIQLLGEMTDLGMVNVPFTSAGLNLAAVGNLLQEGIVSVTKVGQKFFSGFYTANQDDEED